MTKYTIYILMLFAGLNTFAQTNRNRVLYFGQRDSIAVSDYSKIKTFDLSGGKVYYEADTWDNNAIAYLDSTGITNITYRTALNDLVKGLKHYHIWDSCLAIYPMMGNTASQHKWNLKDVRDSDDAYRLTFSGTVNHTSDGCDWDGINGYADTHVNPSAKLKATSIHTSYYATENTTKNTSGEVGSYEAAAAQFGIRSYISGTAYNIFFSAATNGMVSFTNANTKGYYIMSRVAYDSAFAFKDGVRKNVITTTSGAIPNATTHLGRYQNNYSDRNCSFATVGSGLTSGQCDILDSLVQEFQTKIERGTLYAWIFIGQSNMMANVKVDSILNEDNFVYKTNIANGYIWNNAKFESITPGVNTTKGFTGYFGPETSFTKDLVSWSGRDQYIIKRAFGATYLNVITSAQAPMDTNDWNASSVGERLYEVDTMIINANTYVTNTLQKKLKIMGIVWMQGEYDAKIASYANAYYDNLIPFFDTLTVYANRINIANGFTNNPIKVIGKISNSTAWPYRSSVRLAETNYVEEYGDILIDNDDLPLKWDNAHWTPDGIITFGKDIATAIQLFYP